MTDNQTIEKRLVRDRTALTIVKSVSTLVAFKIKNLFGF